MKVSIIGAGNVATHLALALKKSGHEIVQIFNRSNDAGKELAHTVAAAYTSDASELLEADIYLVAVKDDVIEEVANLLSFTKRVVAHTSGTKSKEILKQASENYGIFYPLQTLKKKLKVDFKNVPVLIEGSNEEADRLLGELARSISQNVHRVSEEQRLWIHVAAVFANNFTNHLYGISEKLLAERQLPFDILKPLIFRAIENLALSSPEQLQTGPAARNDVQVIEKHLSLLANHQQLQQIYELLSQSIITQFHQQQK